MQILLPHPYSLRGFPRCPEILRIKITHQRFFTLFFLWQKAFLVWGWARNFSTNPPFPFGKNGVWCTKSRGAAWARNGKLSCLSIQHVHLWKGWKQLAELYQRTTNSCLLLLGGKDLGHERNTASSLTSIFIWLWENLLQDRFNVSFLLEKRWHVVSPQKITLNSKQKCGLFQ